MATSGVAAALIAALGWAVATALFRDAGREIPPLVLNLLKGLIASSLMAGVLLLRGHPLQVPGGGLLVVLLLSGVVGIGIGDTAYLKALGGIGVRRVLLLELLAAPVAAIASWMFIAEVLDLLSLMGILLTLSGVSLVIGFRGQTAGQLPTKGVPPAMLMLGLLAALCQGLGAVMARYVLEASQILPLTAALLRLSAGTVWLLVLLSGRRGWLSSLGRLSGEAWRRLLAASLLGTFLGLWLQQLALDRLPAGIAQTLLSTSPLFALVLAAAAGRKAPFAAWLGTAVALAGIALLALRQSALQ